MDYLEDLEAQGEEGLQRKTTFKVKPFFTPSARRELHYNIMKDIEKRLADVTIGQLLKDSPAYRKQVLDAVKLRRRKRLPSTIHDVRYTEIEDWGHLRSTQRLMDASLQGYR